MMKSTLRRKPHQSCQAHDYYQAALSLSCSSDSWEQAERYLRYAACQYHQPARQALAIGLRHQHFQPEYRHLNRFAIEVLETLVTPDPTQAQIDAIESALRQVVRQTKGGRSLNGTKAFQISPTVALSQFMKEEMA